MSTAAAPRVKGALYDACTTLYAAPVQVAYGHPGLAQDDDIVSLGRTTSQQEVATFGTGRSREETVTCEVVFSCYRGGGPEAERFVEERAFALLAILETYVRTTDTTLGGVVRWCELTSTECIGATDPDVLALGRCVDVIATFTAHVRL